MQKHSQHITLKQDISVVLFVHPDQSPDQSIKSCKVKMQCNVCSVMQKNLPVSLWTSGDMRGIGASLYQHSPSRRFPQLISGTHSV